MKRRILMVSAMILLLGSQVDVFAQKRVEPERKRPGMEMKFEKRPGRPMDGKAISQMEILWRLMEDRRQFAHKPHGPKPCPMKPAPGKPLPPRK